MNPKTFKSAQEFFKIQTKLTTLNQRKQQLTTQLASTTKALEELSKTNEEKVFKIISNILIQKDVKDVIQELEEKKRSFTLQLKKLEAEHTAAKEELAKWRRMKEAMNAEV